MLRNSRFAAAALAGIVAVGSLAATLATSSPALADDHRGGSYDRHDARDRGNDRDDRRNFDRGRDWHPTYYNAYPQPVYPAYPAYPAYPYYPQSNGYIHVSGPGWGVGFSL